MIDNIKAGSGLLSPLIQYVFEIKEKYTHRVEALKRKKGELAATTFAEYLHRLDLRYDSLKKAEDILKQKSASDSADILERQLVIVDRTEAYHQHVYSTLSALMLFLSHVAHKSFVNLMPIRSVSKFLNFAKTLIDKEDYRLDIDQLRLSVTFRNQFVDHPQQHALYNWATIAFDARTIIVYFKPDYSKMRFHDENEFRQKILEWEKILKLNDDMHQDSPCPIELPELNVSPDVEKTHNAILNGIKNILNSCDKSYNFKKMNDTWDRYTPSTLKEIIYLHKEKVQDSDGLIISTAQFPSRVRAKYTGEFRQISIDKKELINLYFKAMKPNESYANIFPNEYLFYEETTEHWLPVQSQVAKFFDEELSPGDIIYLYCVWMGAIRQKNDTEWVFSVNEFEAKHELL